VKAGGHDAPERKIRERYQRLWPLVATAITRGDSANVYDDSALEGPRIIADMSGGHLVGAPDWPQRVAHVFASRWPA
jgi:predicted ABC-type ATPase